MLGLGLVFFHLGQNVANNLAVKVFGDPQKLRPAQEMIEIVFHLVIFRKTPKIGSLDLQEILDGGLSNGYHSCCFVKFGFVENKIKLCIGGAITNSLLARPWNI